MLGLTWGCSPEEARLKLGLPPLDADEAGLSFSLDTVVARLVEAGAFCPGRLVELQDCCEGQLHLAFERGGLAAAEARFRYSFEVIGKSADGLSDLSMAAFARTELQTMIFEFTACYGPPVHVSEEPMRWENTHPVGTAQFRTEEHETVQVLVGHDGDGVMGTLRYLPPMRPGAGF